MSHRILAVVDFAVTPFGDAFLVTANLGSQDPPPWKGEAWDLAIELVLSNRIKQSFKSLPQSSLAFIEFVSKEAPHDELSVGKCFDVYYGFKRVGNVRVINVAGSEVPNGRVRSTKPVKSDFDDAVTYPAGTEMVLLESLDEERGEWLVEVRVPDESLVGGASYDVVQIALTDTEPMQ